jgi:hypothetical protein
MFLDYNFLTLRKNERFNYKIEYYFKRNLENGNE